MSKRIVLAIIPFLSCVALASMECSVDEDVLFSVPSSFSQSKGNHVKDASSGSFIAFQEDSIAYFVKNEPNLFSVFGVLVFLWIPRLGVFPVRPI